MFQLQNRLMAGKIASTVFFGFSMFNFAIALSDAAKDHFKSAQKDIKIIAEACSTIYVAEVTIKGYIKKEAYYQF